MGKYDDIINLPHHVSTCHPHMAMYNRAAQFAPFAALSGHSEAIAETARLTRHKIELDEYEKIRLNEKILILNENIKNMPEVTVTYFCPDEKKEGGRYVTVKKTLKKINNMEHMLIMEDGVKIPFDDIFNIN